MTNQFPGKAEIFLALALKSNAKQSLRAAETFMPSANLEDVSAERENSDALSGEKISPLIEYLTKTEAGEFNRIRADYQAKNEAEKTIWRNQVLRIIGTDEPLIDERVHQSHIDEAVRKEIPAVQQIIAQKLQANAEKPEASGKSNSPLGKTIRRTFAKQFVSLRDLQNPTAFDYLSGRHLVNLIRLSGIREVALACVRIEAVESVAAFLRRFSAEDARAVAAQLKNLQDTPESRLAFAETIVQTALEIESQPSAMLDLLGFWLIGILLCESAKERVAFTIQKLPLEVAPKLPEIIERQCRNTLKDLQRKISAEIEHLAEMIARTASDK